MKRTLTALVAALLIGAVAVVGVSAVEVANKTQEIQDDENLVVDVEINDTELTNDSVQSETITVNVTDSASNQVASKEITVDSYGDSGTQFKTVEFTDLNPDNGAENFTVSVDASQDRYVANVTTSAESPGLFGGGGTIGGASTPALLGFLVVVGGLVYAYREDYL